MTTSLRGPLLSPLAKKSHINHQMDTMRTIFYRVGNGINTAIHYGASVTQSLNWGPTVEATVLSPTFPPLDASPSTCSEKLSLLVKVVGAMDQDPTNKRRFIQELKKIKGDELLTLDIIEGLAEQRAQNNATATVGLLQKFVIYLTGFAQYGKTNTMMYMMWRMGAEREMPSVMLTFDRAGEGVRLARSAETFNELVRECALLMGMSTSDYPQLMLSSSSDTDGGDAFMRHVKNGLSKSVPVFTIQGNATRINAARGVISEMSKYVGRDEPDYVDANGIKRNNGSMNALLLVDEA